jgi:hypothetical protein
MPAKREIVRGPGGLWMLCELQPGFRYKRVIYISSNLITVETRLQQEEESDDKTKEAEGREENDIRAAGAG